MIAWYEWHPYELRAFLVGVATGGCIVGWPLILRRHRKRHIDGSQDVRTDA